MRVQDFRGEKTGIFVVDHPWLVIGAALIVLLLYGLIANAGEIKYDGPDLSITSAHDWQVASDVVDGKYHPATESEDAALRAKYLGQLEANGVR